MMKGTIIKGIGGFYYVAAEGEVYECRARGIFRNKKITPTVGDVVEIEVLDSVNKKGSLDKIEKRRNELIRPRVSNVDQAVIVFAAKSPDMNLDLLDRFLLLAEEQDVNVVLCINKIDLDISKEYVPMLEIYEKAGYEAVAVCAREGVGIDELKEKLNGKITVFAGPSGVGKSSILNAVSPDLKLTTGEISAKIERGRHTTRHAELMEVYPGAFIVDSPGFTSLYLEISHDKLQYYFPEFAPYVHECYYNGCSHTHEPECAVKAQIGKAISQQRYERYVNIYQELQAKQKR